MPKRNGQYLLPLHCWCVERWRHGWPCAKKDLLYLFTVFTTERVDYLPCFWTQKIFGRFTSRGSGNMMVFTGEANRTTKAKDLIESAFGSIGNREAQPKGRSVIRRLPVERSRIHSLGYSVMVTWSSQKWDYPWYDTKRSCDKYGTTTTESTVSNCDRTSVDTALVEKGLSCFEEERQCSNYS